MFIREVATSDKDGNVIRYAQVVASYRNAEGKPRHKVLLSLGRVDRIDREMLRRFVRNLLRYLGDESSLLRPRVIDARDLGIGIVVAALWNRLGLGAWLGREAAKIGLSASAERSLLAMIIATLAGVPHPDEVPAWLAHDAYLPPELGELATLSFDDARTLLRRARTEIERGLYLRRSSPDGTVYVKSYSCASDVGSAEPSTARMEVVVSSDSQGFPVASEVGTSATDQVPALVDRLRKMGARRIVWSRDRGPARDDLDRHLQAEDGATHAIPLEARRTINFLRRGYEGCMDPEREPEERLALLEPQLTMLILARLLARRLEIESGLDFETLRAQLRTIRAVHLSDGENARWESTPASDETSALLEALGVTPPPRILVAPDAAATLDLADPAQVTND